MAKEESPAEVPLTPNSPREQRMVERFKKTIARHLELRDDKTTEDFMEDFALDLWRITRGR